MKEMENKEVGLFFEAASQKKAMDLIALDLRKKSSVADYFILASGSSSRQVTSIAEEIKLFLKEKGKSPLGVEGLSDGRWVLLDYGDVVVHIFFDEVRRFYDLEGLWADVPVIKPDIDSDGES